MPKVPRFPPGKATFRTVPPCQSETSGTKEFDALRYDHSRSPESLKPAMTGKDWHASGPGPAIFPLDQTLGIPRYVRLEQRSIVAACPLLLSQGGSTDPSPRSSA